MRRSSHFRVVGRLDSAARVQTGTITIDGLLFSVRPLRRRRSYDLPLSLVADMVVQRVLRTETFRARMEKAKSKKARRK